MVAAKKSKKKKSSSRAVWDRAPPAKAGHTHLSPQKKASAKARAKRAGRPYPNLVDNMRAARKPK
jgi:hypothetical protein